MINSSFSCPYSECTYTWYTRMVSVYAIVAVFLFLLSLFASANHLRTMWMKFVISKELKEICFQILRIWVFFVAIKLKERKKKKLVRCVGWTTSGGARRRAEPSYEKLRRTQEVVTYLQCMLNRRYRLFGSTISMRKVEGIFEATSSNEPNKCTFSIFATYE